MGIIHCSRGRNMKSSQIPTEFDQNNRDVTSIQRYVIKKNSSRGLKHGPSERQKMYHHAKPTLKKARQGKHGGHPTILSRWYGDEKSTWSHCLTSDGENITSFCSTGSLEKHIYKATRAERIQIANKSILTANSEGGQMIAWRAPGENPTRIQRYSSQSTNKTAKRATIWRPRRIRPRHWPWNRVEVLQRIPGKSADICVRIRGQPATSFVIVVNVGQNPVADEQLKFSAFPKPWRMVIFSELGRFRLPGEKIQPTDGECEQHTHNYSTYRVAHSMITFHHSNTRCSRSSVKMRLEFSHQCHIFVIRVETTTRWWVWHVFLFSRCFSDTPVRVDASHVFLFFLVCLWSSGYHLTQFWLVPFWSCGVFEHVWHFVLCLCCEPSVLTAIFVIHAQIEKCSQVIHDDRRTGSRAVLLLAHQEKLLRHYASIPHHLSCCLQIAVSHRWSLTRANRVIRVLREQYELCSDTCDIVSHRVLWEVRSPVLTRAISCLTAYSEKCDSVLTRAISCSTAYSEKCDSVLTRAISCLIAYSEKYGFLF